MRLPHRCVYGATRMYSGSHACVYTWLHTCIHWDEAGLEGRVNTPQLDYRCMDDVIEIYFVKI